MQDNLIHKIKGGFNVWTSINYDYSSIQNKEHVEILKKLLTIKPIKTFLEIGTHEGLSATYIAGDHGEGVLYDWGLTKHCGRIIFHDYKVGPEFGSKFLESYKYIIGLIESLPKDEVDICPPFAYWEKK